MTARVEHVEIVADGILLYFKDGREALLTEDSVVQLAETTHAFEVLLYRQFLAELDDEFEDERV